MSVKSFKTSGVKVDLAPQGLVLLNTTSFSAVSSFSLPANTFTATYNAYRIVLHANSVSTTLTVTARLRAAGTDESASQYFYGGNRRYFNGTAGSINANPTTSWAVYEPNIDLGGFTMDVVNPFLSQKTYYNCLAAGHDAGFVTSGALNLNTSYDSMSFIASTGNMTGTYSVYGYNK
jgi:hypothetical protein